MAYSDSSPRKCRGKCGKRKPASEFDGNGRVCFACRRGPSALFPLGDGRTRVELVGSHARGRFAYVSDAKVPLVAGFRWRVLEGVNKAGSEFGPYAVTKRPTGHRGGETVYMHILIMGRKGIDHRDGDPLNNTDPNLFVATQSENLANSSSRGGSSQYKAVYWYHGKWRAKIKFQRRSIDAGMYDVEQDAGHAVDLKALEIWGLDDRDRPVYRLNFPLSDYIRTPDGTWRLGEASGD